jgi:sodium/bile acid cotransporter 7
MYEIPHLPFARTGG